MRATRSVLACATLLFTSACGGESSSDPADDGEWLVSFGSVSLDAASKLEALPSATVVPFSSPLGSAPDFGTGVEDARAFILTLDEHGQLEHALPLHHALGSFALDHDHSLLVPVSEGGEHSLRKLDSAGNSVWEQVLSGEGGMYDVLVTRGGKIRVLGEYATQLEFAGMKLGHTSPYWPAFVAQLSESGQGEWSVALDSSSHAKMATTSDGSTVVVSTDGDSTIVTVISPTGMISFSDEKLIGEPVALAVDTDSFVVAAESWSDGNVTTIARYPLIPGASAIWTTSFHEPCSPTLCPRLDVQTLAIGDSGHAYAGGQLRGSMQLGSAYYGKGDGAQLVLVGLEHDSVTEVTLPRESEWSMLLDLELTNEGFISGVGIFKSSLVLDVGGVTSVGEEDVFALRLRR